MSGRLPLRPQWKLGPRHLLTTSFLLNSENEVWCGAVSPPPSHVHLWFSPPSLSLYSCLDRGALGEPKGQEVRSTDRGPYCGPTGNALWLDLSSFM